MDLSQISIAAVAGLVLSLAFSYIPGLKDWYDRLTPTPKRALMALALIVVTAALLAYKCRAESGCYGVNFETYVAALIASLVTNQSTADISPIGPKRRLVRKQAAERHMYPPVENRTNEPQ